MIPSSKKEFKKINVERGRSKHGRFKCAMVSVSLILCEIRMSSHIKFRHFIEKC